MEQGYQNRQKKKKVFNNTIKKAQKDSDIGIGTIKHTDTQKAHIKTGNSSFISFLGTTQYICLRLLEHRTKELTYQALKGLGIL